MKMSEQTDKIFSALSKAQGELGLVEKNRDGHGYKYADLGECISTAQGPLKNNGLAITQLMGNVDNNTTLITMLTHSSGQYIASEFIMEKAILSGGAGKNPAQGMGASITYMRRYAFAAIIGLAQEDTDAAEEKRAKDFDLQSAIAQAKVIAQKCTTIEEMNSSWPTFHPEVRKSSEVIACFSKRKKELIANDQDDQTGKMTDAQRKAIMAHFKDVSREDRLLNMSNFFQTEISSTNELTKEMASEFIDAINRPEGI